MKKTAISLLLFISVFILVSPGYAEVRAGAGSFTACVGGYTFEGNEDLKTAPLYGLRAGYNFTENLGIEGYGHFITSELKEVAGTPDMNLYGYGVEGLWHFMPESRLVPFLAMGAGNTHYEPDVSSMNHRNKFTFDWGGGLKFFLTENVALRADIRHVIPYNAPHNNLLYTLGITYTSGGAKKTAPVESLAEAPVEVVRDSDGDGVPDYLDKCPGTPAGVKVDENGCPIDADKDGIPDYLDKCPGTPASIQVDENGCPFDSDKDGIPDYLDKCPGTPASVQVDKDGCPVEMQTKREAAAAAVAKEMLEKGRAKVNIEFAFDKAVVKPKYHDEIRKFADVMKDHRELNVVIEGHTDSIGKEAYNQKLSEKRAASVKDYMIKTFGIEASRLSSKGYGMSKPIDSNKTAKGRQKNRRVEAVVDYTIKK
jgi:OOP family OmpA-OmpF porin